LANIEVFRWRRGPEAKQVVVLKESVDPSKAEAEEDARGETAAALACDQYISAGSAFGVDKCSVLFDDELPAQGNHEEYTQPAAKKGESEDAGGLKVEAQEDERGKGEDHARRNGLACVASGLNDIIFEDTGTSERAEN